MQSLRIIRILSAALMGVCMALGPVGCGKPTPVTMICVFDSSKSALPFRSAAIATVKALCSTLDGNVDRLSLYHMGQTVYSIYSGPAKVRRIGELLDTYAQSKPEESGTAYGLGVQRALDDADLALQHKHNVAVVILGDGADEYVANGGNIQWASLQDRFNRMPVDRSVLAFLYVHPQWGDAFTKNLEARFYDRLLVREPKQAQEHQVIQDIHRFIRR